MSNNSNSKCSSIIVCLMFARRGLCQPDFTDILDLCEGCYNPLEKTELKNVCRGKNFV